MSGPNPPEETGLGAGSSEATSNLHLPRQSSSSSFNLVIKAANQKYPDFVVDCCEVDWSIKRLKQYLSENYPKNPDESSIRLIYSGKLLHDHGTLKDCIRANADLASHVMHLVHSPAHPKLSGIPASSSVDDMEDELTPVSSLSSSTASSASSSPNQSANTTPFSSQFNSSIYQNHNQPPPVPLTPKQQYTQIHSELLRNYEALGISVQTNPWYSSYVQQSALYYQMYNTYLQSINGSMNFAGSVPSQPTNFANFDPMGFGNIHPDQFQVPPQAPQQPTAAADIPVPPAQRARANQAAAAQDAAPEEDWLGVLHNLVSFFVLFSIVYFYSSFERFMVVFSVIIFLILYHKGWMTIQRRQVNPVVRTPPAPAPQQPNAVDPAAAAQDPPNEAADDVENVNNNSMPTTPPPPNAEQQSGPNIFRLMLTFVLTFFTSLVPERQRLAAN